MELYRITVRGKHETLVCQSFYGLAHAMDEAMALALSAAEALGWESPRVDASDTLGRIAFQADNSNREAGQ
ncbi:MAG: hypothetical protein JSW66_10745 [Phycisphaerales bacterium]|nr:MAG: hypothetical protein JSW66_10745 [Phycisphaerales bacterium]